MIWSGGRRRPWFAVIAAAVAVSVAAGCTNNPEPAPSPSPTAAPSNGPFAPGADGLGDRYYPKAGNGGYDVGNYELDVTYEPATKELTGVATISASATTNLTSFNLDFTGLKTNSITVNGSPATADQHSDGELVVTPATNIAT